MSIMASLGTILSFALNIYLWMILARVLISWISPDPYNPVVRFLVETTEPVLGFFRRWIPPIGMLDLSPIWAMLSIQVVQRLISTLFNPAASTSSALLSVAMEVVYLLHMLVTIFLLLMVIRVGMNIYSWNRFRKGQRSVFDLYNPGIRFLFSVTEGLLRPMRRWVPTFRGLDLTPVVGVAIILLVLIALQDGVALLLLGMG
ncbi:MAG: YggT family protein [Magnetococcales bacterium]|nr:YggT family protein [Magnetococcales bacterium]NGZ26453.1 YggT family protein [Magnetococcales bacterium]